MKILLNNQTLIKTLGPFSDIGFVPTMGGIHKGHISLINKSIKLLPINPKPPVTMILILFFILFIMIGLLNFNFVKCIILKQICFFNIPSDHLC